MPEPGYSGEVVAYIDGGARGNPGPAAYAVVMHEGDGSPLEKLSQFIGDATNNEAEYHGLLAALDYAVAHHLRRLRVVSDSELLVRQIKREYKVKSERLKPLYQQAQELIARIESFAVLHVPREQNREADRLVNVTLDTATIPFDPDAASLPTIRAWAVFQEGVLRPRQPLQLKEGEEVSLEIRRKG